MIKSTDAVSEVLGMLLILSAMMIVIAIVMLVGNPMIESAKNTARMDVTMSSFLSLQNDIEEVVRGPIWVKDPSNITYIDRIGPSRETEIQLMGGTMTVLPTDMNVTCEADNGTYTVNMSTGTINFRGDREFIAYENGGVIRKYETGKPLMVSNPLMNIYHPGDDHITVSIHAVSMKGDVSSTGGDGLSWVETRLKYYNQTLESEDSPNSNQTTIRITTSHPSVWERFFDDKLQNAGLAPSSKGSDTGYNISGTMPLEVEIYGMDSNRTNPDIFLSVYESGLDVTVR